MATPLPDLAKADSIHELINGTRCLRVAVYGDKAHAVEWIGMEMVKNFLVMPRERAREVAWRYVEGWNTDAWLSHYRDDCDADRCYPE